MKVFHCDNCEQTVFYENSNCVSCGHVLAYLPDIGDMATLEPAGEEAWRSLEPRTEGRLYKLCENYAKHAVCNWAIAADDPLPICRCCQLTRVIPNLEIEGNREAWRKLELAKRRLVYSLLELKLPLRNRVEDPEQGLAFDFLSDAMPGAGPVLTGHDEGVITINVAEADDVEREKRRLSLHEPYRTLLGHFRHEVGHYYWNVLVRDAEDAARIESFRQLFGDEREDYGLALKRHYEQGAPADWQQRFVSAYASAHPWEDWAETWAHYLHMIDSLETAAVCGLALHPHRRGEPVLPRPKRRDTKVRRKPFDALIDNWVALTYALNNLNRSLGLPDGYPFVLATPSIEKLRFVHETLPPH